jgi:hypothetical protein
MRLGPASWLLAYLNSELVFVGLLVANLAVVMIVMLFAFFS